MGINEQEYQAAIPKCCEFQTVDEHLKFLMLCWGLTSSIQTGKPLICGRCEFNKDNQHV